MVPNSIARLCALPCLRHTSVWVLGSEHAAGSHQMELMGRVYFEPLKVLLRADAAAEGFRGLRAHARSDAEVAPAARFGLDSAKTRDLTGACNSDGSASHVTVPRLPR